MEEGQFQTLLNHGAHSKESGKLQFKKNCKSKLICFLQESTQFLKDQNQSKEEKLTSTWIIGVTCCSVVNTLLFKQSFDILILDECRQIIEPLSLLPLIKSKAK